MEDKKSVIYPSSKEALMKIFILMLTIGISVFASFIDLKSCYITILVQACNNMYDFYCFTDNRSYTTMIKREAIAVIIFSIAAIIMSIIALLGTYNFMQVILVKLFGVLLVTVPLFVVYNDYRINIKRENETGAYYGN